MRWGRRTLRGEPPPERPRSTSGECAGKVIYLTVTEAKRAAVFTSRLREQCHVEYHCMACHAWHVGSNLRKAQRVKRR